MSVTAVSFYRGGSLDQILPLAKRMNAILDRYGVSYRVSRLDAAEDLGDWLVVVRYADRAHYEAALNSFAADPEHSGAVADISKVTSLVRRVMAEDLDL